MGWLDSLFGGESTKGIKFQRAANDRAQDFIEQQSELARNDVLSIVPGGIDDLNEGYSAAIDVNRKAGAQGLQLLQRSNQRAQEAVLGGMDPFRRAIMGLPTGLDPNNYYNNPLGMRPQKTGAGAGAGRTFFASEQPDFLAARGEGAAVDPVDQSTAPAGAIDPEVLRQLQALFPNGFGGGYNPSIGDNLR